MEITSTSLTLARESVARDSDPFAPESTVMTQLEQILQYLSMCSHLTEGSQAFHSIRTNGGRWADQRPCGPSRLLGRYVIAISWLYSCYIRLMVIFGQSALCVIRLGGD